MLTATNPAMLSSSDLHGLLTQPAAGVRQQQGRRMRKRPSLSVDTTKQSFFRLGSGKRGPIENSGQQYSHTISAEQAEQALELINIRRADRACHRQELFEYPKDDFDCPDWVVVDSYSIPRAGR